MKLFIANRAVEGFFYKEHWVTNPDWVCAPYELVQVPEDSVIPTTIGPFRFLAKDIAKAEQCAKEQDWDGLHRLAVKERIPPP